MPEIQINNRLKTENGNDVSLKPGARVEVTVLAENHHLGGNAPPEA
jgi:hypothetical protein